QPGQKQSAVPPPEAVGTRWGDPLREQRQPEVQGSLDRWAPVHDHGAPTGGPLVQGRRGQGARGRGPAQTPALLTPQPPALTPPSSPSAPHPQMAPPDEAPQLPPGAAPPPDGQAPLLAPEGRPSSGRGLIATGAFGLVGIALISLLLATGVLPKAG